MSKKLQSPIESIQASTREPSQRSGEVTSLDATSLSSSRRFLLAGTQVGGGSYEAYIVNQLTRMHDDIEQTTRRLEVEQRRLSKLDKDVASAEAEYDSKRHKYKLHQTSQDDTMQHKDAEVRLEKKLIKAIADLNKLTSENGQLREQIDLLRRERAILNTVFRQLERGISSNKQGLSKRKVAMNEENSVNEEKKQKTKALSKMMEKERGQFQSDAEKLKKQVRELNDVQTEKGRPSPPERTGGAIKGKVRRAYMVADEEEAFQEQLMRRRILKLSFLNTIQRRHIKQHQKNIEVFEQAFNTIRSSTGISDIEEIVKIFIILEQRNFSLLTYVNQLNQDIENVFKRNRELECQMKDHKHEEQESSARKDSALSEVTAQIVKTKASTQEKTKMIKDAEAALDDCRPLVVNVARFLKQEIPQLLRAAYEATPANESALARAGMPVHKGEPPQMKVPAPEIQEESLNSYLTFIEASLSQFKVSLQPETKPHQDLPKASRHGHGEVKVADRNPRIPNPTDLPSAHIGGDESDDDPETGLGDRPWTRSELRERAQAMIQRRRRRPPGNRTGHEARPMDAAEDNTNSMAGASSSDATTRKDAGPPPPNNYAASSVTSKESGGESGPTGGSGVSGNATLSKSPSMSGKQASAVEHATKDSQDEDDRGKAGFRDDLTWRNQGKEKKK